MKMLAKIYCIVCVLMFVWLGASYIEIVSKNTHPNPEYSPHNAILLIFGEE